MTPATFITRLNYFARVSVSNADGTALFNLVDQDLQTRAPWRVLQVRDQAVALTAGVGDLPDDFRVMEEVRAGGDVCQPINYSDRHGYSTITKVYWIRGSQIGTPNTDATTLTIDYTKLRAPLPDETTDSDFPTSFDPWYVQQGLGMFWHREGNYGKASNHLNLAENILQGLIAGERKTIKGRPGRARHILAFFPRRF